jgi:hypothetical protein
MKTETTDVLEKNKIEKNLKVVQSSSSCCGGAPTENNDACCKLDEEKKAEGQSGCGCNTGSNTTKSSCC